VIGLLLAALLAQEPSDAPPASKPLSKKDALLAAKSSQATSRPLEAGDVAVKPIWAHNLRTHEIRVLEGPAGMTEQAERSAFFRCWFTAKQGPIPGALVERILASARHFEVREVRIISGFRAPKYNLLLRKKGREVAESSEHSEGLAIDFFLPGIGTRELYEWLLGEHEGGVGFYPVSEFVHIDLGRKRTWKGT
jgi:hypothetical protein